jgi:hypothetical protein
MKTIFVIFLYLPSVLLNAQVIDLKNFNEHKLNDTLFGTLSNFNKNETGVSLIPSSIGEERIYRFIRRNHRKMTCEVICGHLNDILRKYDSKFTKTSGIAGNLGIIDCVSTTGVKIYQDLAGICITDWKSSPSDYFFMVGWGAGGEVICFYDKKPQVLYVFFVLLR